jgi:hypothetical protein
MSVKDPNPLNRPDVWSLSASSTVVDASSYWAQEDQIHVSRQIVNTAGDPLTGLKRRQGEISMTVKGNRAASPFSLAASFINRTNSVPWANGEARTWLCTSVSAQQQSELVGTEILDFWSVSFAFAYRPETWDVQAANVGLNELYNIIDGNVIVGTGKRRITIQDANGNDLPTPKPLPLDSAGAYKGVGSVADMLSFQVYKTADFQSQFGDPPT